MRKKNVDKNGSGIEEGEKCGTFKGSKSNDEEKLDCRDKLKKQKD